MQQKSATKIAEQRMAHAKEKANERALRAFCNGFTDTRSVLFVQIEEQTMVNHTELF